jgi:hypothetical protein
MSLRIFRGVRISERIVGHQQAVDVVAVIVRDDHGIDGVAVDTGGGEIAHELAADAVALLVVGLAGAGIDHDELGADVQANRVIGRGHHVLFHEDLGERGIHHILLDVDDVILRHLEAGDTIGRDRHFEAADLVAVPAGGLLAGSRRRRAYRTGKRQRSNRGRACGSRQQIAACECGHWRLPLQFIFKANRVAARRQRLCRQ